MYHKSNFKELLYWAGIPVSVFPWPASFSNTVNTMEKITIAEEGDLPNFDSDILNFLPTAEVIAWPRGTTGAQTHPPRRC